jgi:hypothetical protein
MNNPQLITAGFLMITAATVTGTVAAETQKSPDHYSFSTDIYSDKDDLNIQDWQMDYQHGANLFHDEDLTENDGFSWGADLHKYTIRQRGAPDYDGHKLNATIGKKINTIFSLGLGLGQTSLEDRLTGKDQDLTHYSLQGNAKFTDKIKLQVKHERSYLFREAILEDASGNLIDGDTTALSLNWRPAEKWRAYGTTQYRKLSDGNKSQRNSGAVLYGISPGWPWIWAGVSGETLSYDKNKPEYWTPEDYASVSLVLDSSFPVNDALSLSMGGAISRSKEDDNPGGTGYSASIGADWQVNETMSIKAGGSYIESSQESSTWKEDNLNLSVNIKSF